MVNYEVDFQGAIEATKKLGFILPTISPQVSERFFDDLNDVSYLVANFEAWIRNEYINNAAMDCFRVCWTFKDFLLSETGVNAILTIGYTTAGEDRYFYINEKAIRNQINENSQIECKGHCWLTLPSMEIVDPTLVSSLLLAGVLEGPLESVLISKHWSDLNGVEYHPVVVGEDYLCRGGVVKYISM